MTHHSTIDSLPTISPDALETVIGGKLPPGIGEAMAEGEKAAQSGAGKKRDILSDAGIGDMGMGNLGGDTGTGSLGGDMGMGDMG